MSEVYVIRFVFVRCICGLLKKKPRILVTHQLQYLKAADEIVVLKEVCLLCDLDRWSCYDARCTE